MCYHPSLQLRLTSVDGLTRNIFPIKAQTSWVVNQKPDDQSLVRSFACMHKQSSYFSRGQSAGAHIPTWPHLLIMLYCNSFTEAEYSTWGLAKSSDKHSISFKGLRLHINLCRNFSTSTKMLTRLYNKPNQTKSNGLWWIHWPLNKNSFTDFALPMHLMTFQSWPGMTKNTTLQYSSTIYFNIFTSFDIYCIKTPQKSQAIHLFQWNIETLKHIDYIGQNT